MYEKCRRKRSGVYSVGHVMNSPPGCWARVASASRRGPGYWDIGHVVFPKCSGRRCSTRAHHDVILLLFLRFLHSRIFILFFLHFYFPASGQAVVTGVVPSPPLFLPSTFIAHRIQQSHCSSIFNRVLLTHALALSASQFVHKKTSQLKFIRVCTRRGSNSRN